jgi:DNA modification methylase
MKKVKIGLLRPNTISSGIYGDKIGDENFLALKHSIGLEGILEPLIITNDFFIISGVRRYFAAIELGMEEVPVIISTVLESQVDEYMVISHQQQRFKTNVQILKEIDIISEKYNLKQGRKSSDPIVVKGKKEREDLIRLKSKSTIERLKEAKKNLLTLHNGDEKKVWEELHRMENEGKSVDLIRKETNSQLKKQINTVKMEVTRVPQLEELYKIYDSNSKNLSFILDESVDCVFTSPPYFNMRDYSTGENQIGRENCVENFIKELMIVFNECKNKMKPSASMFINIMDTTWGKGYLLNVPGKLKQALIDNGFFFVSEIIWVKENPIPTKGKRPQPCFEYIFHFTKSLEYKYYKDWMTDEEFEGHITFGDFGKNRQLRNFFDYRSQVAITSVSNNSALSSKFRGLGYALTHSATMPFEVASVGILSTTEKGDIVLDPFSGLGTTGLAAISQDRYYIGVDNNPEYIEQAKVRLNLFAEDSKDNIRRMENLSVAA